MSQFAEVQGAEGHRISLFVVEDHGGQGLARCTCGWSRQDVLPRNVHYAALRHAQTSAPVEELAR